MNIFKATADFEQWLAKRLPIVRQDVALKHALMAQNPFSFFRATFYRWLQHWPEVCPKAAKAPTVLGVGDLHIENFGTWRDTEGRLIWGVNDLDEVFPCAYTIDLVRLLTSVYLAIDIDHITMPRREAAEAIEEGYRDSIADGGQAFILAEHHTRLRLLATSRLRDPVQFWDKLQKCPTYTAKLPDEARNLIENSLPLPKRPYQLLRRVAGLGSLGHPRIVALSSWQGALIARETKGIGTSAWVWYKNSSSSTIYGAKLVDAAIRVKDPTVRFGGHWSVRRLAPDCSRIELSSLAALEDESQLLYDMGWEAANMHFGSPRAIPKIKRDLAARKGRWLHKSAKAMLKVMIEDWEEWRRDWKTKAHTLPASVRD